MHRIGQKLRHSMLAQMMCISLLFVIGFLSVTVFKPLLDNYLQTRTVFNTIENTVVGLRRETSDLIKSSNANLTSEALVDNSYFKRVLEINPNLKFTVQVGDHIVSNQTLDIGAGKYLSNQLLLIEEKLSEGYSENAEPVFKSEAPCININHTFSNGTLESNKHVIFYNCYGESYSIEFSGLKIPVLYNMESISLTTGMWYESKGVVYSALGLAFIFIVILNLNLRGLKRTAAVARTFDPNLLSPLPEKGVPLEVLPFIYAVNEMIEKVRNTKEKHDFFLSTAAHELRTPLAVLRTRLAILDDCPVKELMISDIKNITNMVNQLLTLMRTLESTEIGEQVDLAEICHSISKEISPLFFSKNVSLDIDLELDKAIIKGDRYLLKVALTNLLSNALSFSKAEDKVVIALNKQYQIQIIDQGPGIAPQDIDSIFEPFAKFPSNRRGHYGLGLAIVNSIASLHKITITADNNSQSGAVFTLDFLKLKM